MRGGLPRLGGLGSSETRRRRERTPRTSFSRFPPRTAELPDFLRVESQHVGKTLVREQWPRLETRWRVEGLEWEPPKEVSTS